MNNKTIEMRMVGFKYDSKTGECVKVYERKAPKGFWGLMVITVALFITAIFKGVIL